MHRRENGPLHNVQLNCGFSDDGPGGVAISESQMRHIVILAHSNDAFAERGYALGGVAEQWRQSGFEVTVATDPEKPVAADIAILHVDLTVVPENYLQFMRQYPVGINAGVKDISKRHISANLVTQGDGYEGSVIIKTNLNCGGMPEGELAEKKSLLSKYTRAIRRRLHWSMRAELGMWNYPIFDSVKKVPWVVWRNPSLVVERFLPERKDGLYCMRSWMFLGDAEENRLMYANQAIIKSPVAVRIESCDEIPEEIREMRHQLGFDFGKFDYGIVNGRVVLYDANRTPVMLFKPSNLPKFKLLAKGIESFFGYTPRLRAAG